MGVVITSGMPGLDMRQMVGERAGKRTRSTRRRSWPGQAASQAMVLRMSAETLADNRRLFFWLRSKLTFLARRAERGAAGLCRDSGAGLNRAGAFCLTDWGVGPNCANP